MSDQLKVLVKPCGDGTCPAIYQDEQGRVFIQGNKLSLSARQEIALGKHEEVVEISSDLIDFLRTLKV